MPEKRRCGLEITDLCQTDKIVYMLYPNLCNGLKYYQFVPEIQNRQFVYNTWNDQLWEIGKIWEYKKVELYERAGYSTKSKIAFFNKIIKGNDQPHRKFPWLDKEKKASSVSEKITGSLKNSQSPSEVYQKYIRKDTGMIPENYMKLTDVTQIFIQSPEIIGSLKNCRSSEVSTTPKRYWKDPRKLYEANRWYPNCYPNSRNHRKPEKSKKSSEVNQKCIRKDQKILRNRCYSNCYPNSRNHWQPQTSPKSPELKNSSTKLIERYQKVSKPMLSEFSRNHRKP